MRLSAGAQQRRCMTVLVALTLFAGPVAAQQVEDEASVAEDWGVLVSDFANAAQPAGEIVFDVVVLRPVGAVQTLLGVGFFAVAAPFVWLDGSIDEAWELFVQTPFDETFTRELGSF